MQARGPENAAVQRQLLRRGGVGAVRAHGGEGVRDEVSGGGGGANESAGGGGAGDEARRRRGGVGPSARGGVRPAIERAEDGGHQSVGAGDGVHGE